MLSNVGGAGTGTISAVKRPSSVPAAAFMCERNAKRSCDSRVMPFNLAILSADCPIDSPVLGSAMAGVIGMKSLGRSRARMPKR